MVSAAADASSRHVHRKDLEPAAGIALPLSTHVLCRFSVTISTNLPSSPGVPRAGQLGSAIAEGAGGRDGAPGRWGASRVDRGGPQLRGRQLGPACRLARPCRCSRPSNGWWQGHSKNAV